MAWRTLGPAAIPGGAGPVTHPGGQGMIPGAGGGSWIPAPGIMQPVGHITAVFRAQPHPVAHILEPIGLAPAAAAAGAPGPGGSNGGCEAQDGFVKQRVDVSIVVVTVVLVTKKSLPRLKEAFCNFCSCGKSGSWTNIIANLQEIWQFELYTDAEYFKCLT